MEANWNDQVGTSGYSKLAIQPLEYATKHGLPPALCNVLKYLLRDRGVCKLEDYAKMRDCIIKGADLTIKHSDSYRILDANLIPAIHEIGITSIETIKKYIWGYAVLYVMRPRIHEKQYLYGDLAIKDLEDIESEKHGYREAAEKESPDLDYTKFSGRKWVKIQKDV